MNRTIYLQGCLLSNVTEVSLDRASPSHTVKENPEIAMVKWLREEGRSELDGESSLSPHIQEKYFYLQIRSHSSRYNLSHSPVFLLGLR